MRPLKFIALALVMLISSITFATTFEALPDKSDSVELFKSPNVEITTVDVAVTTNNSLEVTNRTNDLAIQCKVLNIYKSTSFIENTNVVYFREKCGKPRNYINILYKPGTI
jgi:hypothetical protein